MRGLLIGLLIGWWLAVRMKRQASELTPATQEYLIKSWRELGTPGPSIPAGPAIQSQSRSTRVSSPATARTDPLEDIHGIGPVFADRLREAGIATFAELARANPDHLREVVSGGGRPIPNVEDWVEEARQRAQGIV
jgi:predicted flap endonuclease-1-like 5' DNA nuclease